MTIVTSQGHKVETIEVNGRSTPFRFDDYVVIRVAVDGRPYPSFQIPAPDWNREASELREPEFWQNIADGALSMGDAEAMLRI